MALRLRSEEKCLSWRGFAGSELGIFFFFISMSTGGLNTRWLSRARSAGYNLYTFRNKMKQVASV